ncbi:MAG TPA: hypothetical protein VN758_08405 [Solirubrobacterales bacterium]|nr:hypothetical protein [Solirubrobacterales bacterium]
MSVEEEVAALARKLAEERSRLRAPGHEVLWAEISESTGSTVARLVSRIERERPELFGCYGSLEELHVAIIGLFDHEEPSVSSAGDLFAELEAVAEQGWVIASPLANLMPPTKLEALSEDLALVPASPQHGDWFQIREEVNSYFGSTFHQLDGRVVNDSDGQPVDTRRGAWLVSRESGSLDVGEERAMVRARLVLATWTLLKPPKTERYMSLWPVASEWLPQPYLHVMQRSVDVADNERERNATVLYDEDELALYRPPEGELRRAPIAAIERAASHRPAVRLLGAAWSLYLAARPQTDLQWIDRLMLVQRARNQICELPGGRGSWQKRWEALSENLAIVEELAARGFDQHDIEALSSRAWDLRNISAHSADAILISLGYPPERQQPLRRNPPIPGSELAPLHIREGIEAPFAAAHFAATKLWTLMMECEFNEASWEELFQ